MQVSLYSNLLKKLIFKREDFLKLLGKTKVSIAYINPVNYFVYRDNPSILNKIDFIHLDNIFFVILFSLVFRKTISRLSFDMNMLAKDVFEHCVNNGKTIFFTGGSSDEIESFVEKIRRCYPSLNIRGHINGYVSDEEILDCWIKAGKSDFFIVGLGNMRQELFLSKLSELDANVLSISCGAFISQTAGASGLYYYPNFFYKFNLRWLYRIIMEKGIVSRILVNYPRAFICFLKDIYLDAKP